jgi:hypothetical protein
MKKAAFEKKEEKIEFYAYLANAHFFGWKDVLKEMKAIKKEILRSVEG